MKKTNDMVPVCKTSQDDLVKFVSIYYATMAIVANYLASKHMVRGKSITITKEVYNKMLAVKDNWLQVFKTYDSNGEVENIILKLMSEDEIREVYRKEQEIYNAQAKAAQKEISKNPVQ